MKKIVLVIIIFISFIFVSCSNLKQENVILAEAENIKVYLKDFLYFFNNAKEQQDYYLENLGFKKEDKLNYWNFKNGEKTAEEDLKENILNLTKYQATALSLAKENNVKIDNKELKEKNKQIDNFIMSLGSIKKRGEVVLKEKYGITPKDLKSIQKNMLLIESYAKKIGDSEKNSNISEEEIKDFYNKNKKLVEKKIDMKVTVKHILIKCDDSMDEKTKKSKENLANSLLEKIKKGEDIGKLVKQYSEDTGSINNKGEYTFGRGEMVEEFENWSFENKINDVGIVKTLYGYHIIKIINKPTFESMYDKIKEYTTSHIKREKAFNIIEEKVNEKNLQWKINEEIYNKIKINYVDNEEDNIEKENNKVENKEKGTKEKENNEN